MRLYDVCNTIQTAVCIYYYTRVYIACAYTHIIIIINRYIREKQSKFMQSVVVCSGVQYTNIIYLFRVSNFIYA